MPPSERLKTIIELASSERFRRAWALLDATDEINRLPAFEGVRRMLASRDLRMEDLLEVVRQFPIPSGDQPRRSGAPYDSTVRKADPPAPHTNAGDRADSRINFLEEAAQTLLGDSFIRHGGLRRVIGADIPRTIVGTVEELGSRHTPFGEVLSFAMRNAMCVYGPIAALDPSNIERLRTGADTGARMKVDTLPRHGPLMHPSASRVSVSLT